MSNLVKLPESSVGESWSTYKRRCSTEQLAFIDSIREHLGLGDARHFFQRYVVPATRAQG